MFNMKIPGGAWVHLRRGASGDPKPLPSPTSRPLKPHLPLAKTLNVHQLWAAPHSCLPFEPCFPILDWQETPWTHTHLRKRAKNPPQRSLRDTKAFAQRVQAVRGTARLELRASVSHASRTTIKALSSKAVSASCFQGIPRTPWSYENV